jgi:AcrR family transcriptional regulator
MTAQPARTADDASPTRRRPGGRRDVILGAALELFAKQGYQATGIDEIGAAAGVSGPAIYRHFGSKHELLAAAFSHSFEQRRVEIRERLADATGPEEALELLVRDTVENSLRERSITTLYTREIAHLPREERKSVLARQRLFTNDWVKILREVNPALTDVEARMAVTCVHSLIATLAYTDGGMPREPLEQMLVDMSLAALAAAGQGR